MSSPVLALSAVSVGPWEIYMTPLSIRGVPRPPKPLPAPSTFRSQAPPSCLMFSGVICFRLEKRVLPPSPPFTVQFLAAWLPPVCCWSHADKATADTVRAVTAPTHKVRTRISIPPLPHAIREVSLGHPISRHNPTRPVTPH